MSSTVVGRPRWRPLLLLSVLLAALGFASPAAAEDNPPLAYGGSVTPNTLDSSGGQVTIEAGALDDYGVVMFYANVTGPDTFVQDVQMGPSYIPNDPYSEPTTYTGTFTVPVNFRDFPVTYYVNTTVTDGNGQTASAFIGEVIVAARTEPDEPPTLWEPAVTPTTLPNTGGTVKFGVSAFDDTAVTKVVAHLGRLGQQPIIFDLSPINANRYEAYGTIPPNTGTEPVTYAVTFSSNDEALQNTVLDGGTITVAPPPVVAATGLLQVSPAAQLMGPVRPGRTLRRNVVVRNTGKPGSGTVNATAAASGPFAIIGASTLQIAPGETKIVVVEFRPKKSGAFAGRLTVTRPDNRQRPLVAQLTGLSF